jgi:CheY-like chemotaxis protein
MEANDVASEPESTPEWRPLVLIVDDDPATRLLYAANLGLGGFDVIEAGDGQEGLKLALAAAPDLVLLDISMPILDGFGLAAALRENERTHRLPFVFLSGEVDPDAEAKAYEAGALGFFAKPHDPSIVATFVQRVLAHLLPEPGRLTSPGGQAV